MMNTRQQQQRHDHPPQVCMLSVRNRAPSRPGAFQVRQWLNIREHFWRGNARCCPRQRTAAPARGIATPISVALSTDQEGAPPHSHGKALSSLAFVTWAGRDAARRARGCSRPSWPSRVSAQPGEPSEATVNRQRPVVIGLVADRLDRPARPRYVGA